MRTFKHTFGTQPFYSDFWTYIRLKICQFYADKKQSSACGAPILSGLKTHLLGDFQGSYYALQLNGQAPPLGRRSTGTGTQAGDTIRHILSFNNALVTSFSCYLAIWNIVLTLYQLSVIYTVLLVFTSYSFLLLARFFLVSLVLLGHTSFSYLLSAWALICLWQTYS